MSSTTSIFGKTLDQVTVDDVRAFCDKQTREGINLDYKKDLSSSKSITKTIAAFANTRGGWVIVGVEDKDDKPVLPADGMDYVEHLPLTVTNMVLSNMWPPAIPIMHVCPPDKDNKTFLILYVPESDEAPHWLFNKKELYVRLADRTKSGDWEEFATSDEWEWLRNKRGKSIELRKEIQGNLESLFLEYDQKNDLDKLLESPPKSLSVIPSLRTSSNIPRYPETKNMLNLTVSPLFPNEALMEVEETYDKLDEIAVPDYYGTSNRFPIFLEHRIVYQTGTSLYETVDQRERKYFTALDIHGMFMFKETILFISKPPADSGIEPVHYVEFARIIARLEEFLASSLKLYKSIGFSGLLSLDIYLHGESWMQMKFPVRVDMWKAYTSANGEFYWSKSFLVQDISEEKTRYVILREVTKSLMFVFGWKDFNWTVLDNLLKSWNLYQSILK